MKMAALHFLYQQRLLLCVSMCLFTLLIRIREYPTFTKLHEVIASGQVWSAECLWLDLPMQSGRLENKLCVRVGVPKHLHNNLVTYNLVTYIYMYVLGGLSCGAQRSDVEVPAYQWYHWHKASHSHPDVGFMPKQDGSHALVISCRWHLDSRLLGFHSDGLIHGPPPPPHPTPLGPTPTPPNFSTISDCIV